MRRPTRIASLVVAGCLTLLVATLAGTEAGPGQPGPGRPVPKTEFAATLWTPPLSGETFFCYGANVSEAPLTVKIEIVINQGFVVATSVDTIEAGTVAFATFQPQSPSICYCRLSLTGKADDIRGSLQALDGTDPRASAAVQAR